MKRKALHTEAAGLTPMEFANRRTRAEIEPICVAAGTTYDYWIRIRDRRRRPSVDLARALVAASGGVLDLDALLFPRSDIRNTGAPPIRPALKEST